MHHTPLWRHTNAAGLFGSIGDGKQLESLIGQMLPGAVAVLPLLSRFAFASGGLVADLVCGGVTNASTSSDLDIFTVLPTEADEKAFIERAEEALGCCARGGPTVFDFGDSGVQVIHLDPWCTPYRAVMAFDMVHVSAYYYPVDVYCSYDCLYSQRARITWDIGCTTRRWDPDSSVAYNFDHNRLVKAEDKGYAVVQPGREYDHVLTASSSRRVPPGLRQHAFFGHHKGTTRAHVASERSALSSSSSLGVLSPMCWLWTRLQLTHAGTLTT
jgi:hypothetical protein